MEQSKSNYSGSNSDDSFTNRGLPSHFLSLPRITRHIKTALNLVEDRNYRNWKLPLVFYNDVKVKKFSVVLLRCCVITFTENEMVRAVVAKAGFVGTLPY